MNHLPRLLPVLLIALGAPLLPAQDQIFLSGAQIAVVPLVNGGISADGADAKWDNGYRVELNLRDYYYDQQVHHPFAELGFFYESHETSTSSVELDAETFAVRGSVGSAIPLWRTANDSVVVGLSPELGIHLGMLSLDAQSNGVHSDDDAFRYGASAGVSAWALFNRAFGLGLGVVGSYWRATSVTLSMPGVQGNEERSDTPSGWDLGLRLSAAFTF